MSAATLMRIDTPGRAEWRFNIEPCADGLVWLHIAAGPMSGGLHMSKDDARELADMLTRAMAELSTEATS